MDELGAMRERLARLEARRCRSLVVALGVVLLGVWAMRGEAVAGAKPTPAKIEAGRLTLRNATGEIVGLLYSNDAGVRLELVARKGAARIQLAVDNTGKPRIHIWDADGIVLRPVLEDVPEQRARNETIRKRENAWKRPQLARAQCERYHDLVMQWKLLTKSKDVPADLRELEKPLRPGGAPFTRIEKDPWGGDYFIEVDDKRFRIVSPGPDGIDATDDDIVYPPHPD